MTGNDIETVPPAKLARPRVRVGLASHVGRVRTGNEDAALALLSSQQGELSGADFGLFIVADGMGGQEEGQWAADLAARAMARSIVSQVYLPFIDNAGPDADRPPLQEALLDAVRRANEAVHQRLPESGTTLTAALLMGAHVYLAHVGDSRAYLVVDGRLEQLTRDHSLVERLHEMGQLSTAELAQHPNRNVLYRAIGQGEGLEVDVTRHALGPGTRLLLCCDGLWGLVPEARMAEIVLQAPSPQDACNALVSAALEAGGPDNITALLVEITG